MLKISVTNQSSEATNFQLEGKLVGPWVEELRRLSDAALVTSEAVSLDLEKVWFVDSQGIALLDLASKQVAQVNCSQFISQQLKEEDVLTSAMAESMVFQSGTTVADDTRPTSQVQGDVLEQASHTAGASR